MLNCSKTTHWNTLYVIKWNHLQGTLLRELNKVQNNMHSVLPFVCKYAHTYACICTEYNLSCCEFIVETKGDNVYRRGWM